MANGHSMPRLPLKPMAKGHSTPRLSLKPMADGHCAPATLVQAGGQWPFDPTAYLEGEEADFDEFRQRTRAADPAFYEKLANARQQLQLDA